MALKNCKHNKFMETKEWSQSYKCMNPKCSLIINMCDTVDMQNGEHESIEGEYGLLLLFVRKQ